MGLEQAIKQEKFPDEHEKAMINILVTASWLHGINTLRLKPFGITPEQFNVLRILRGSHPRPLMLAEISGRMIDKNSNATRLVEKLRQKGFLVRKTCEHNRRQVDISITEAGLKVLEGLDKGAEVWLDNIRTIDVTEAFELNKILDKLRG